MKLPELLPGVLLRRYKRFLADVVLDDGATVTAHCANTGSMLGLATPGQRVWLSRASTPGRKLAYTWELVEVAPGVRCGIHTGRANALVEEALGAGLIPALAGWRGLRREARLGEGSRSDLLLDFPDGPCHLEVKSVTGAVADGEGFFPDAVSLRAAKHLKELAARVAAGERAAVVFCAQRPDVASVRPADQIDPGFGQALRQAAARGVELYALGARVDTTAIVLDRPLAVRL